MATAQKQSRKALKQPDEFVQTGNTVMHWFEEHRRQVVLAVVGALVLGLLIAIVSAWTGRRAAEAGEALGQALSLADRPVLEDSGAGGEDFFPTEAARREAVKEALASVRADHAGSPAAALAALELGELAFDEGAWDEARSHYQTFLDEAGRDHAFRFAALEGLALVAEAQGDAEAEVSAWTRVVEEGNDFYEPFALVGLAKALEAAGRPEEARAKAQQVLDAYEASPARAQAEAVLARLPAAAPAESAGE